MTKAERLRANSKKYRESHKDKERERVLRFRANNPNYTTAANAARRAAKLLRTPSWSETEEIKAFYKARPKGYHVDHIIPLQGENVSGLHVLGNLQYLKGPENISKGNKFTP